MEKWEMWIQWGWEMTQVPLQPMPAPMLCMFLLPPTLASVLCVLLFLQCVSCCNSSWREFWAASAACELLTCQVHWMLAGSNSKGALMSPYMLGCCHPLQNREAHLDQARRHCCHVTTSLVHWIRPWDQVLLSLQLQLEHQSWVRPSIAYKVYN